jgi:hypothetical protein
VDHQVPQQRAELAEKEELFAVSLLLPWKQSYILMKHVIHIMNMPQDVY